MKAFADSKINVTEKMNFFPGRVENIVGKGEKAGYKHFLLFPQCFQKASFTRSLKDGIEWLRVNMVSQLSAAIDSHIPCIPDVLIAGEK